MNEINVKFNVKYLHMKWKLIKEKKIVKVIENYTNLIKSKNHHFALFKTWIIYIFHNQEENYIVTKV